MLDENSWRKYSNNPKAKMRTSPYARSHHQSSEVRRQKQRNRRLAVLLLSFVVVLFSAHRVLTHRDWYLLQHIRISGTHYLSYEQVVDALGLHVGSDNLHEISRASVADQLKQQLIYVSDANVSKTLLQGELAIRIIERTPSVMLVYDQAPGPRTYLLADLEGAVLQSISEAEAATQELPVIEVTSEVPPTPGTRLTSAAAMNGLEVIRIIRERLPQLEQRLVRIYPDDAKKIRIELNKSAPAWLAAERIENGLRNLLALLEQSHIDVESVAYIDARFQGMVYCGG